MLLFTADWGASIEYRFYQLFILIHRLSGIGGDVAFLLAG